MTLSDSAIDAATLPSTPRYELRVRALGNSSAEYEIWQLPAPCHAAYQHCCARCRPARDETLN